MLYVIENVIYDFSFNLTILFIFLLLMGFSIVLIFCHTKTEKEKDEVFERLIKKLFSALFICIGTIFLVESITKYKTIAHEYKLGQYQSVEGEVVAFHSQSRSGNKREHFIVDQVYFSYSQVDLSKPGYNGSKEIGNGQHLLIKYYTLSKGEKVILYIEELDT